MKRYLSLPGILTAALFFTFIFGCEQTPASRKKVDLKTSEYAKEAAFAVEAVSAFNKDKKLYAKFWTSHGDIYQSSLRLLTERPMKTPKPVNVYRYGSSENLIVVELAEEGHPGLIVNVWKANGKLSVADLGQVTAKEKK